MAKQRSAWITLTTGEHAGKTICLRCHCQRVNESDPDPCLGELPGVVNACCGHGVEPGYITFEDGKTIIFDVRQAYQMLGPERFDPQSCDDYVARTGKMISNVPLAPRAVPVKKARP